MKEKWIILKDNERGEDDVVEKKTNLALDA
jgi:hypothetical protein